MAIMFVWTLSASSPAAMNAAIMHAFLALKVFYMKNTVAQIAANTSTTMIYY